MDSAGTKNQQVTVANCFVPLFKKNLVVKINCLSHSSLSGPLSTYSSQ